MPRNSSGHEPAVRCVNPNIIRQTPAQRPKAAQTFEHKPLPGGAWLESHPEIVRPDISAHLDFKTQRAQDVRPKSGLHRVQIVFSEIRLIQPLVQQALVQPAKIRRGDNE